MTVLRSWWAAVERHTGVWDVMIAAFLVVVSLVEPGRIGGNALSTLQIALLVTASAALALRRAHPVAVLIVTVLAVGAVAGGFGFGGFFIITQGNFVKIMPANVGFLFRHFMFYLL